MRTYKIKVANHTLVQKYIKVGALFLLLIGVLVILNQRFTLIDFGDNNLERYIILFIAILPPLILGSQLRKVSRQEEVSFFNNEIVTDILGPIKISEIAEFKSPKNSNWNGQDRIHIKLNNGREIYFAPVVRQFRNKKSRKDFDDFATEFESKMNNAS